MKMTITENDFLNNWPDSRRNQFTCEALTALYEWYTELEDVTGTDIEYDPIAICCEWTEFDDLAEAGEAYGCDSGIMEYLQARTHVIETEAGTILVMDF